MPQGCLGSVVVGWTERDWERKVLWPAPLTRACLFLGDVSIDKRVHARILQRGEGPTEERPQDDHPNRRTEPNGRGPQELAGSSSSMWDKV